MRKIAVRLAGVAAAGLAFAAMLTAAAAPVAALPGSVAAGPVAAGPRLAGCNGLSHRPSHYDPICNDGNGTVVHLHWSTWGTTATGRGEFYTRQCGKGGCVSGPPTVILYPVNVTASRVRGGDYTRFRFSFPGQKPAWAARSWVIAYSGDSWHGKAF